MLARLQRNALFLSLAVLTGLLLCASAARADGTPDITATVTSQRVLHGEQVPITVRAANPIGQPYGYNLSFRVVLPAGVTRAGGPTPTQTIANQPGTGQTTLIFSDLSDLSPNSSYDLNLTLDYSTASYDVGDRFDVRAQAFVNSGARIVPRFDTTTGLANASTYTGSAGVPTMLTGTTTIDALDVEKDEPSPEAELLRGVHDHQTTYTVSVRNNLVNPTDNVRLVDYVPAGLEFLGCGGPGADHTTSSPTTGTT